MDRRWVVNASPLIVLAKQEGKIEKVSPVFEQLQDAGLRIDAAVLAKALQLAGE